MTEIDSVVLAIAGTLMFTLGLMLTIIGGIETKLWPGLAMFVSGIFVAALGSAAIVMAVLS